MLLQHFAKGLAGILAAAVRMQNPLGSTGALEGLYTQLGPHVRIHLETSDASIIAIQHGGQIEFPVQTGDLRDVSQPFFVRLLCRKVLLQQIIGLLGFGIGFCQTFGSPLAPDDEIILSTYPMYRAVAPV